MQANERDASLRPAERKQLLALLEVLGSPEPAERAAAALQATTFLRQKGLPWSDLVPPSGSRGGSSRNDVPEDWRDQAITLLENPDITEADRAFLAKIMRWRSPGIEGWARLRGIAERLSLEG